MRKPTAAEKWELVDFIAETNYKEITSEEYSDERANIEHQAICVFDDYITDCPGYAGRVMVVVWGASPEYTETFIWRDNKLTKLEIEV